MKIAIINGLLSAVYILVTIGLVSALAWMNNAVGMRVGPRKDAGDLIVVAGGTAQRVGPEAMFGGVVLCAAFIGGVIGWAVPTIWLIEGRETWIDLAAQVIGCLCGIGIGYMSLGWLMPLGILSMIVFAMAAGGFSTLTYLFPSLEHSAALKSLSSSSFVTDWREQRLLDEASAIKQEETARLKAFMAPFVGKWVVRDQNGKVVEGLSIDKDGIEELDSKGRQTWGMVVDWEIAGDVLVANRNGETRRLYAMREGPNILSQGIKIEGLRFSTKDKKFVRASN